MAYVRTVKTASGAIAVQIVWSTRGGSRRIEHLGSAHDDAELEALKAAGRQRLAEGQGALDLGLDTTRVDGEPLEIVGSKASHLWDALCRAYQALGFDTATGGDEVLRDLVLARIIEPTSKADSLRVLSEAGVELVDYRTVTRRLPVIAKPAVRQALSAACAAHAGLGPASLVLYDVSTLYFETDAADGFREPGFSKERQEPDDPPTEGCRSCALDDRRIGDEQNDRDEDRDHVERIEDAGSIPPATRSETNSPGWSGIVAVMSSPLSGSSDRR
jgi:hypothetical protein